MGQHATASLYFGIDFPEEEHKKALHKLGLLTGGEDFYSDEVDERLPSELAIGLHSSYDYPIYYIAALLDEDTDKPKWSRKRISVDWGGSLVVDGFPEIPAKARALLEGYAEKLGLPPPAWRLAATFG